MEIRKYHVYYINEKETIHIFQVKAINIYNATKEAYDVTFRKSMLQGKPLEDYNIIKIEEV